MMKKSD
jgi:hypothetical protein